MNSSEVFVFGLVALLSFLCSWKLSKTQENDDARVHQLLSELKADTIRKTSWLQERHEAHITQITNLIEIDKDLKKEIEVLTARQRTLERKLAESPRIVNVNISDSPKKEPTKKGQGIKSLVPKGNA